MVSIIEKSIQNLGETAPAVENLIINKNNDIVLICKSSEETKTAEAALGKIKNINLRTSTKFLPKLIITNIPIYEELTDFNAFKSNLLIDNKEILKDVNENDISILFSKTNYMKNSNEVIIKVTPKIRLLLLNKKLKLGLNILNIRDHHYVKMCCNCGKYGHSSKSCNNETLSCMFCSDNHSYKECPIKTDKINIIL